MDEPTVVLRDEHHARDHRHLAARLTERGALRIEGCDLGDGVEAVWGEGIREYEWSYEIEREHLVVLGAALGGALGAAILDVLRARCVGRAEELERVVRELGIATRWWSRTGD